MNSVVRVKLRKKIDESYGIVIGYGFRERLAAMIARGGFGKQYCVITDSRMKTIYGKKLLAQFGKAGVKAVLLDFPAGEKSKNMKTVSALLEKMLASGIDRKACVVALGGGVAGDVAGFAASIYMRGINFVQVPTTLLAMADSSIGGKTGVDLSGAKNSAGSFSQPKKVYACLEFLETLPKKEISNGMSEVVKHAIISDVEFFAFIEKNLPKVFALNRKTMLYVVKKNCEAKARVVEKDEKEGNYRRVVNFGHTIGHALEVLGKFSRLSHGQAISIGMVAEAEISRELGLMPATDVERIRRLFMKIGLPVRLPAYGPKKILAKTRLDKKAVSGKVFYSLPARIGKMHSRKGNFGIEVSDRTVLKALGRCG